VRQTIRIKGYSYRTEKSYIHWIKHNILYHDKHHPREMGKAEVEEFLGHLVVDGHVAASTQNQALSALRFLYREVMERPLEWIDVPWSKKPKRLPVVLTPEEVQAVMKHLTGVPRLVVPLLYGSGLRLSECLRLRVKDLDFGQKLIIVRDGKGIKDRTTMLPQTVIPALKEHLRKKERAGETSDAPHLPSCLCHTPAGKRLRHSHDPGVAWAQGRKDDHDLHACCQPGHVGRSKPARLKRLRKSRPKVKCVSVGYFLPDTRQPAARRPAPAPPGTAGDGGVCYA
jgi:integrase